MEPLKDIIIKSIGLLHTLGNFKQISLFPVDILFIHVLHYRKKNVLQHDHAPC